MNLVKKKYKIILTIILIACLILNFLMPLIMSNPPPSFSKILPGKSMTDQFGFLFLFLTLFSILGVLSGYLLSPLFLIIHKKIIGKKSEYSIQDIPVPEKSPSFNMFFPSLMAINLAMMGAFSPTIQDMLILSTYSREDLKILVTFAILMIITLPIAIALFSSAFFLFENGFVVSNEQKVHGKGEPIEVNAVGRYYLNLLKGYAGIGVILSYIVFVIEMLDIYPPGDLGIVPAIIILPLFPFLLMALSLPAIIISGALRNYRKKFLLKFAHKIGISKKSQLSLKYLN